MHICRYGGMYVCRYVGIGYIGMQSCTSAGRYTGVWSYIVAGM